jgi:hypothetical protein
MLEITEAKALDLQSVVGPIPIRIIPVTRLRQRWAVRKAACFAFSRPDGLSVLYVRSRQHLSAAAHHQILIESATKLAAWYRNFIVIKCP